MKFRKLPKVSRFFCPKHILPLILVLIVVFAAVLEFSALQSMKREKIARSVKFDKVPVDEEGVLRFVAVDTATGEKISTEDWIRIISDSDTSDLEIQKLVTILKVSKFGRIVFFCVCRHLVQRFLTLPHFPSLPFKKLT